MSTPDHTPNPKLPAAATPPSAAARPGAELSTALPRPRGRAAVTDAILDAAGELLAERGVAALSLREVAASANVNLGLIHRHVGNKHNVIDAVLARTSDRVAGSAGSGDLGMNTIRDVFVAAADSSYWRMLAQCLLSPESPDIRLQDDEGVLAIIGAFEKARAEGAVDEIYDPRLMAGMTIALGMGWLMFEPKIRAATGLDESGVFELRLEMWEALSRTLRRIGPDAEEKDW